MVAAYREALYSRVMRPVHQLVHTLSYGDAISTEVLSLQRTFRAWGIDSDIYAINVHPTYQGRALDYRQLSPSVDAEIILHYSLGSPLNALYRSFTKASRCLIFHNLTPAHWFEGINPRIVADIQNGVAELPELCRITNRLIADSQFNARELNELGFSAQVLELPFDPQRWSAPANAGIAELVRSQAGIQLLHVGRLAPNKCIEDIIRLFYFLRHYIEKQSRLWLVGIDTDTELYSFGLKRLVRELGLDGAVEFVGCMADEEVRALYENCDVYVCMSEHEGFCLPVVEAMHFGLPVVAFASSALTDTVGSGGILVKEKRPAELAELCAELVRNTALRQQVVAAGRTRVAEFSLDRFESDLARIFAIDRSQAGDLRQRIGLQEGLATCGSGSM